MEAFAKKTLNGKNLFRRKHGFSKSIAANSVESIILVVPYSSCRINQVEFVNAVNGDTVNLKVLDTTTGLLTTVPSYMLNQFGFDVQLPNGLYVDKSEYDASLIGGMQVLIEYSNNSSVDIIVGGNIIYHEEKEQ
tara:strand:+ start:690 stop:1094 length:405 start_codon:yes stop_codon:yes gene_type:complete